VFSSEFHFFFVMPDPVPGIHVLPHDAEIKTWMAGINPAMTTYKNGDGRSN
jgi:hypothetical protein